MSVPLSRRTLSKVEYYNTAFQMRLAITNLLLRDFGIKDKIRSVSVLCGVKGVSEEDKKTLDEISQKYSFNNPVIERYPAWLVDHFRLSILELLRNLILNITAAENIHVTSEYEYNERRMYQTKSIVTCEQLLQEMQYVIHVIPCDIEKFMPYVEMIEKEIGYLKDWRKRDNKILSRISNSSSS